jgi:hypothetical protein
MLGRRAAAVGVAVVLAGVAAGCTPAAGDNGVTSAAGAPGVATGSGGGGAATAAVAFVAAAAEVAPAGPIARRELLAGLVTDASFPRQVVELEAQIAEFEAEVSGSTGRSVHLSQFDWVESPLRVSVEEFGDTAARVEVWSVSIFGQAELGPPQTTWRTLTLDVMVEGGRWLVDEVVSIEPGPTPVSDAMAVPDEFDAFAEVAAWSPVGQRG